MCVCVCVCVCLHVRVKHTHLLVFIIMFAFCRKGYKEAKSFCESHHGSLVEVESGVELEYLQRQVRAMRLVPFDYQQFWLGLRRKGASDDGMWHWESSGEELNLGLQGSFQFHESLFGNSKYHTYATFDYDTIKSSEGGKVIALCEAPSKFVEKYPPPPPDPRPKPEMRAYQSAVTNSTYLFANFSLPWPAAQKFCEEKGGYLAAIQSFQENENLISQTDSLKERKKSWWLGAREKAGSWIWAGTHGRTHRFTDWKSRQMNEQVAGIGCLALSDGDEDGYRWQRESCLTWNRFICEIPSKYAKHIESPESVSDERCIERDELVNGTLQSVKNCFRCVKLQYNHFDAERYCQSNLGLSGLAKVDEEKKEKFELLLGEQFVHRKQVSESEICFSFLPSFLVRTNKHANASMISAFSIRIKRNNMITTKTKGTTNL